MGNVNPKSTTPAPLPSNRSFDSSVSFSIPKYCKMYDKKYPHAIVRMKSSLAENNTRVCYMFYVYKNKIYILKVHDYCVELMI